MTQNANHVVDLIADEDIHLTEGQGFTLVLGEFIPHPPHVPRITTHRDTIIQECDLSRLFSLSLDEDDTIGNHPTPSLTEQGSSTAEDTWGSPTPEPTWGRYTPPNYKEDLKLWETTNVSSPSSPTISYRECEKCTSYILTSTKVFHSGSTFTCVPCLDGERALHQTPLARTNDTHATTDDEQEFGGIPIPTSDVSSDDFSFDDDLSSESEDNKSDTSINCMNSLTLSSNIASSGVDSIATVDMAFTLGPVRDGIVLHHTLSPIPSHPNPYSPLQDVNEHVIYRQCMQTFHTPVHSPTRTLATEKEKSKQKRKRTPSQRSPGFLVCPIVVPESPELKDKSVTTIYLNNGGPSRLPSVGGRMNEQRTTTEKDDTDSDDSILLYNKASNSYPRDFDESNAEAAEKHELIENKFEQSKRSKKMKRPKQSVIGDNELVEGTNYEGPLTLNERMEISVKTQEALDNNDFDNIPTEYLVEGGDIFPEIWKRNFPLPKPSLQSSSTVNKDGEKSITVETKNQYKEVMAELKKYQKLPTQGEYYPLPITWDEFQQEAEAHKQHPLWDQCSPKEYYLWTTQEERIEDKKRYQQRYSTYQQRCNTPVTPHDPIQQSRTVSNNVQHLDFQHNHEEQEMSQRTSSHPIDVIFDTGAAITMLPREYTDSWTNLRPCLHKITGCFNGVEQDNNYIYRQIHSLNRYFVCRYYLMYMPNIL